MRRIALVACVAALGGCSRGGGAEAGPDPNDKRATALACLTEEKQIDARPMGRDSIQVGAGESGPRVRFFLTGGEAEAEQFKGRAEGSEHIGSALLFSRNGSEEQLQQVEECLSDL